MRRAALLIGPRLTLALVAACSGTAISTTSAPMASPTTASAPTPTSAVSATTTTTFILPPGETWEEAFATTTEQAHSDIDDRIPMGLEVSASGFAGISEPTSGGVTWGVVIKNPNVEDYALNTEVQVDFLDASGVVVASVHDYIGGIPPGRTGAVAGSLSNVPTAASMQITQHVGQWESTDAPNFSARFDSEHPYHEGDKTIGLRVSNPFTSGMSEVRLVTIFRDSGGQVAGGHSMIIDCVPNTRALVQVPAPIDLPVASISGYATWTADSKFGIESGC